MWTCMHMCVFGHASGYMSVGVHMCLHVRTDTFIHRHLIVVSSSGCDLPMHLLLGLSVRIHIFGCRCSMCLHCMPVCM